MLVALTNLKFYEFRDITKLSTKSSVIFHVIIKNHILVIMIPISSYVIMSTKDIQIKKTANIHIGIWGFVISTVIFSNISI